MIQYADNIGMIMIPYVEHATCEYHKNNPGIPFAGCCCSSAVGHRKATPAERRTNIEGTVSELRRQIAMLQEQERRLASMLEDRP